MIERESIFLNLSGTDKYDILKQMIFDSNVEADIKAYAYQKVKEREELQSTSVGNGIGVAHAKLDNIEDVKILLGVVKNGIDYDAFDEKDVNLIFVILAPKDKSTEYLKILAKISRICRKNELIESIVNSDSIEKVEDIFKKLG